MSRIVNSAHIPIMIITAIARVNRHRLANSLTNQLEPVNKPEVYLGFLTAGTAKLIIRKIIGKITR